MSFCFCLRPMCTVEHSSLQTLKKKKPLWKSVLKVGDWNSDCGDFFFFLKNRLFYDLLKNDVAHTVCARVCCSHLMSVAIILSILLSNRVKNNVMLTSCLSYRCCNHMLSFFFSFFLSIFPCRHSDAASDY